MSNYSTQAEKYYSEYAPGLVILVAPQSGVTPRCTGTASPDYDTAL